MRKEEIPAKEQKELEGRDFEMKLVKERQEAEDRRERESAERVMREEQESRESTKRRGKLRGQENKQKSGNMRKSSTPLSLFRFFIKSDSIIKKIIFCSC